MPISCHVEDKKKRHQMLLNIRYYFANICTRQVFSTHALYVCTYLFQCKSINVYFIENVIIHGYSLTFEDKQVSMYLEHYFFYSASSTFSYFDSLFLSSLSWSFFFTNICFKFLNGLVWLTFFSSSFSAISNISLILSNSCFVETK